MPGSLEWKQCAPTPGLLRIKFYLKTFTVPAGIGNSAYLKSFRTQLRVFEATLTLVSVLEGVVRLRMFFFLDNPLYRPLCGTGCSSWPSKPRMRGGHLVATAAPSNPPWPQWLSEGANPGGLDLWLTWYSGIYWLCTLRQCTSSFPLVS